MPIIKAHGNNNLHVKMHDGSGLTRLHKMTSETAAVVDALRVEFDHDGSGTVAAGLGVGVTFQVEDAGGVEEQGSLDCALTTVTDGSEDADFVFSQNSAGTIRETLRLNAGHGATSSDTLEFTGNTSETDGIVDLAVLKLNATGTPAANLGARLVFQIDDAGGLEEQFSIAAQLTTVTDGSEDCDVIFRANKAGTLTTFLDYDASAGELGVSQRLTTTDGVSSGTERVVGGRAYTNTAASTAVTNTTTETLFDTNYSIPANTLKAGTMVRIYFQGIATATNSTNTLTVKLYIGGLAGTALLTGTATDVADNDIFAGWYTLICRTAGASGTFVGYGAHTDVPAASGTASMAITEINASTTINTTAAQVIGVGVDWSAADAGNSCRLDVLAVEII